jgi:hypothetical protein
VLVIVDASGNVLVRQIGFLRAMRREDTAHGSIECIASDCVDVDDDVHEASAKLIP